jgi:hypothetical protein
LSLSRSELRPEAAQTPHKATENKNPRSFVKEQKAFHRPHFRFFESDHSKSRSFLAGLTPVEIAHLLLGSQLDPHFPEKPWTTLR